MTKKGLLFFSLIFLSLPSVAQDKSLLQSLIIPFELRENANAIIRLESTNIEILAVDKMIYKNKRIVTILNASADSKHGAYMYYDNSKSIKKLEAKIYNNQGEELKKIRKKDFNDRSAVSGGTLYSDSRVKYLDYTPISYPYTVVFETEVEYSSTAFIPSWYPIDDYYTSSQNVSYKIKNFTDIDLKTNVLNFEGYDIKKHTDFHYSAKNLKAVVYESYSPSFKEFAPRFEVALSNFSYEGYNGNVNDWETLGKWMYDELLYNRDIVSELTKESVLKLVKGVEDPIEKAKIVYKYVQDNTRYISVQEGIGGIQPIEAIKVDEVKYGDCKGLSNYTKSLLDLVGVESYYTRVYGARNIVDVNKDFVKFLGYTNHVILYLPHDEEDIWLECTSQTSPFGYTANFTDDRDVFVITPKGGKIVHTKVYKTKDNKLNTKATVNLEASGDINGEVVSKSYGTQYGLRQGVENIPVKDQILYYKKKWSYINGLDVSKMNYDNDKDSIVYSETIKVSAERYAAKAGNRFLIQPNFFNREDAAPNRYDERTLPFKIDRGYIHSDTYEIKIPNTLQVEALMNPVSIENKFGSYKASISQISEDTLLYQREFILNKGNYAKEEYEAFRAFWLEIVKYDKSKIVLKPNS